MSSTTLWNDSRVEHPWCTVVAYGFVMGTLHPNFGTLQVSLSLTLAYILQLLSFVSLVSTTESCRPQLLNNVMDSMGVTIKSPTNWSLSLVQSFFSRCRIKGRYMEVCGFIMSNTSNQIIYLSTNHTFHDLLIKRSRAVSSRVPLSLRLYISNEPCPH